jgi:hypothetical protein
MRSLVFFIALFTLRTANGQLLDSIALFAAEQPRIVAKLDIRGSFIRNQNVRIMGAKIGLEHAGRFQYGIGYSFLFTPVSRDAVIEGTGATTLRLRLGYITPYVDYAFYQRGRWEVRLPVQLGFGGASTVYVDASGNKQKYQRTGLIVYEPAMTVQYRFMKYLAVGGGWGFRLVWQTGDKIGENLNAPIYSFGLRVFFGDLWNDIGPDGDGSPSSSNARKYL